MPEMNANRSGNDPEDDDAVERETPSQPEPNRAASEESPARPARGRMPARASRI
jgi:hypothetical protein